MKKLEKDHLLNNRAVSKDISKTETIVRRSWRHEVYGFLFGVLAAFLVSCSAACVKALEHAVPDLEVRILFISL